NTDPQFEGSPETLMDGFIESRLFIGDPGRPSPIGLGPDGIFGTSDDVDVDFAEDRFSLHDRFTGFQDTPRVLVHTLSAGDLIFSDGFESGTTEEWTSTAP
ncbi:MAG: hypothetical protein AAGF23_25330, partial [Acidobacteriota bacterium]